MSSLSVTEPIDFAMKRTIEILFRPFRFYKWMCIAVPAALTLFGEGGPGLNFPSGGGGGRRGGPRGGFHPQEALQWFMDHLAIILGIAIPVILLLLALYLAARWLNARGHFMMYDAVVRNSDAVQAPWREFRHLGNSFFRFRLLFDLVLFNLFLLVFIISAALVWPDVREWIVTETYTPTGWTLAAVLTAVIGGLVSALLAWLAGNIVFQLQLPVMYLRGLEARPALRIAWCELFLPNLGPCLLFFLMVFLIKLVQGIWGAVTLMLAMLFTCCTALCLLVLPFVGMYLLAFLSLPVITFERAYILRFVEQFGPAYTVSWFFDANYGFPVQMHDPQNPDSPFPL